MAFYRSHTPRETALSFKNQLLIAVGRHAFMNLPQPGDDRQASSVPLNPGAGSATARDLKDGQEVEIIAWRPRSPQGLAYHVRRLSDGGEWWVKALYLRKSSSATATAD